MYTVIHWLMRFPKAWIRITMQFSDLEQKNLHKMIL